MSQINRRDYLKQMGAVGAIAGAADLRGFTHENSSDQEPKQVSKATKLTDVNWPTTATPPGDGNLTLIFQGLMAFSYKNSPKQMQVGFNKGDGRHQLEIRIFQKVGGRCFRFPSITPHELAGAKEIELRVENQPAPVSVFHVNTFNRKEADDHQDFGWLLDFEDHLFYPSGVTIRPKKLRPILLVSQGTFYTHQLSKSTFYKVDVPDNTNKTDVGHVPRLMGATLNIPSSGSAILSIDSKVKAKLPYINNVHYEIQFVNECFDSPTGKCKWEKPKDEDEEERNDFYMHYFAFRKDSSAKKYGLMAKDLTTVGGSLVMCDDGQKIDTSDESPCMGAGFGQSDGFPPVP